MNSSTNLLAGLGGIGIIIIIAVAILGFLVPVFIAGIYGSVRRIEKMMKKEIEERPERTKQEIHDIIKPYKRVEGSVYPEIPEK